MALAPAVELLLLLPSDAAGLWARSCFRLGAMAATRLLRCDGNPA